MNVFTRTALVTTFTLSALYSQDCAYMKSIRSFDALTEKDRFCLVQTLAVQINAVLPSKVDESMVLSSLTTQGDHLQYHYDLDAKSISQSKEGLRENITRENCENVTLRNMLDIGVTLEHEYKSGDTLWTRFAVDKTACEQI